ncbi:MAG: YitT family protein [Syntrophomonadaceae bacterium]|nr:YitT family protein [Syntrophomonadaceae bacterium]
MERKTRVKLGRLRKASTKTTMQLTGIAIGAALIAISINTFVIPYGLLSGGVSGLALIINYTSGFPAYLGILLLNIPIFLWGFKELDRRLIVFSAAGTAVLILVLPLSRPYIPVYDMDLFLASLFSGIINGLGSGIVFRYGASCGGTDIISMIVKKKKNISVGATSFYCNTAVLLPSLYFFDLKIAMYTAISMWVGGKVTDTVLQGFNHNKSVMIISDKSPEIASRIMNEMRRGVTYLEGQGAYSGQSKLVISCVISNYEIPRINEIVNSIDKKAFIFVTGTVEVTGRGFTW